MKKLKTIILSLSIILMCLFIVSNISATNDTFDMDSTINDLIADFNFNAPENLLEFNFNSANGFFNAINGLDPLNVDSVDNVTKVPYMNNHCGVLDPQSQRFIVVDVYSLSAGRDHEYKTPFTSVESNHGFFDDNYNFEVVITLDEPGYYVSFNNQLSHVTLIDSYYTGPNNEQLNLVLNDPDTSLEQNLTLNIYNSKTKQ